MHTITVVPVSKSQNNRYWPWIQVQYHSTYSLLGLDNDFCDRVSLLWVYMVRPFWHLRPHWSLLRVACTTSMFIYALYSYWPKYTSIQSSLSECKPKIQEFYDAFMMIFFNRYRISTFPQIRHIGVCLHVQRHTTFDWQCLSGRLNFLI